MTTTILIKFSTGHVAASSLDGDSLSDAQIQEFVDKTVAYWSRPLPLGVSSSPEAGKLPVVGWERVTENHFQADRTFRSAWRHSGKKDVVIDMPAAREITAQRAKLSVDDPLIADATTPEELKEVVDKVGK